MPIKNNLIQISIMAKYPRINISKTRLGKNIGMELATELSKHLIKDLITDLQIAHFNFSIETDSFESKKLFEKDFPKIVVNTGTCSNVIDRVKETLERNCSLYEKSVCIFSDVPLLNSSTLRKSIALLDTQDIVLGPDDGGGIYLIAMKEFRDLFSLEMTGKYFNNIEKKARSLFSNIFLLEEIFDIDVVQDLRKIDLKVIADTKPSTCKFLREKMSYFL